MSLELGFMYLIALGKGHVNWVGTAVSPMEPIYPPKPEGSTIPCLPDGSINPDFYGPPAPVSLGGCGPENPVMIPEPEMQIQGTNPSGLQAGSMTIFDWSTGPTYTPPPLEFR